VDVKLLLDENISPKVGEMLRDQDGLDSVHVRERGLLQAADRDVLERAYVGDRVLVTKNVEPSKPGKAARQEGKTWMPGCAPSDPPLRSRASASPVSGASPGGKVREAERADPPSAAAVTP
jgi:Domain of unknown function (DUF5615)